jgi:hypothetical protein
MSLHCTFLISYDYKTRSKKWLLAKRKALLQNKDAAAKIESMLKSNNFLNWSLVYSCTKKHRFTSQYTAKNSGYERSFLVITYPTNFVPILFTTHA